MTAHTRHRYPPSSWPRVMALAWLTLLGLYNWLHYAVGVDPTPLWCENEALWLTFWGTCLAAQGVMVLPAVMWDGGWYRRFACAALLSWCLVGTAFGLASFVACEWGRRPVPAEPWWILVAVWVGWHLVVSALVLALCLAPAWLTFRAIKDQQGVLSCAATPDE